MWRLPLCNVAHFKGGASFVLPFDLIALGMLG